MLLPQALFFDPSSSPLLDLLSCFSVTLQSSVTVFLNLLPLPFGTQLR